MITFIVFTIGILALATLDFCLVHKNISIKEAVILTIFWILLGLAFSIYIYFQYGANHCFEYLAAYFIEKSLSIDNIFVFYIIFQNFGISHLYQREILFVGIWSAIILRIIMIFLVGQMLNSYHFLIYIFGLIILFAGLKSITGHDSEINPKKLQQKIQKFFSLHEGDHRGRFFLTKNGKIKVTILFITMLCIEFADIVFAIDSIPALFSITNDKFIIFSSNAFAIIGLRSLYSAFAESVNKFYYLKHGVGIILCVVGVKMLLSDLIKIPPLLSLTIILLILVLSFILSVLKLKRSK